MKLFILLISFVSLCANAQQSAAEKAADAKIVAAQKKYDAAAKKAAASKDKASGAISNWGNSVSSYFSAVTNEAGESFSNFKEGIYSGIANKFQTQAAIPIQNQADADRLKKSEADVKSNYNKASKAKKEYENAAGEFKKAAKEAYDSAEESVKATVDSTSAQAKQKLQEASFQTYVNTSFDVDDNLKELTGKFDDLREAQLFLDRHMDKSIMAFYMKEKMAKLMNSDALCKAASSCSSGKNSGAVKDSDLNSLFGASSGGSKPAAPAVKSNK